MYTVESFTDPGPINLESWSHSDVWCEIHLFLSACEENPDKQINSAKRVLKRYLTYKNRPTIFKSLSRICVVNWYIVTSR